MKAYNILDTLSTEQLIATVNNIAQSQLTPTSHLFKDYGDIPIIEAAQKHTSNYTKRSKARPALGLIEVVLAANRNYNLHVKPNIERLERTTDLITFGQLSDILKNSTKEEFFKFWGPRDAKKYQILTDILSSTTKLRQQYPQVSDDFDLMNSWATHVDIRDYKSDILGQIKNVAIATIQHLRMTFGCDTVKPDQRVKEVLEVMFDQKKLSDIDTVLALEQIANATNYRTLEIDQMFVNYGAGYFNKVQESPKYRFVIF